jgi:rare lipoprotein A
MLRKLKWLPLAAVLALAPTLTRDDAAQAQRPPTAGAVFVQHGQASWYGPGFHGRKTASGERFDQHQLTAAHRKLPLGTRATVTNLGNGRTVEVEINDRGPYVGGRIIDLSKAAARKLGMEHSGTAKVRVVVTEQRSTPDRSI